MLTIQCTKKLRDELKIQPLKEVESNDPLYSWHADLFLVNRKKCVLVLNNKTRYNFVLYGLKKPDLKNLDEIIIKNIAENLKADLTVF
ncbi:hypothetical protein EV207_11645 [Scopulibacillus darangshiensis]|uniref:DUF6933 domain-containing protein n=1 Tax=Scopulibacillus darangshiensis TaxID=442528 RepID=A0A4R2P1Z8_9BACL|nr:hypothetical protein [Scopulibacillus darangshiensis]TCP28733.1 hypothetical protein EV207_11645 [Scopulibacillus darangshiensis]